MRKGVLLVAAFGLVLASCTGGQADRSTSRSTEVPPTTAGPGAETPEGLSWSADRALPTFARPPTRIAIPSRRHERVRHDLDLRVRHGGSSDG